MRLLKDFVKTWLRSQHYFLTYVRPSEITGFDLVEDMRRLILKSDPTIFDVGANIGQTIDQIRQAFPHPKILAFEPSPGVFGNLQVSRAGPGLQLFQMALGAQEGTATFHEYDRSVLSSVLELDETGDSPFKGVTMLGAVNVVVSTVDAIVTRHGVGRIDLLKIDTQGFDLEVLKGASEALSSGRVEHILVELNFVPLYKGQASADDVHSFLVGRNFGLVDYYDKNRQDRRLAWCSALYRHIQ